MKILLYPHGGSKNHGCEAIVRATSRITGAEMVLASSAPAEDIHYGLDKLCTIIRDKNDILKFSPDYLAAAFRFHFGKDKAAFDKLVFMPLLEAAENCDYALSIGGDNYCYGEQFLMYNINRELRKRGIKTVLWGCSVEPGIIEGNLLDDLKGYDRIVARESLSYESMLAKGLGQTCLFPDPAFSLERKETVLPKAFVENNTVGINISPMIMSYERIAGIVMDNVACLIDSILQKTDMNVALIPHVVWSRNNDRKPLQLLFEKFKISRRVIKVSDRPAEELKDIISRCRFMVAARTHACIAAYSSQVPTIALGYSVKAEGIARDVMPKGDSFVIPVARLDTPQVLWETFKNLSSKENLIKEHFRAFMPDYIGRLENLNL